MPLQVFMSLKGTPGFANKFQKLTGAAYSACTHCFVLSVMKFSLAIPTVCEDFPSTESITGNSVKT